MPKLIAVLLLMFLGLGGPLLQGQTIETFTFTTNRLVPDGDVSGLSDVREINSAIGAISSLKVRLKLTGEFNGDLYGYVRHSTGFSVLLNRPGRSATNSAGYADSGLDVTFQTGAANGDVHVYQDVSAPANGSPLTGTWEPDGRTNDPVNVTDAASPASSLTNFSGLNAVGEWTLYLADVESGGTNMLTEWSLEIAGAAYPTLTWTNPVDIVYGTALGGSQLNATATYDSTNVPGTFAYTPAAGSVLSAGLGQILAVTFTPSDSAGFLPISTNVTLNVTALLLTITANATNKVYGAALPELTASYSGFVNGDDTNDLTALASVTTTALSSSDVGTYPITASGAGSTNYSFAYVDALLTVTQALTTGAVASSVNPALPGTNVTFTLVLSAVAPGAGTPSGAVSFRVDGSIAGSGTLSGGAATFTTNSLTHGSHTVVAEYAGDLNFVGTTNALTPNQVINTTPAAGNDSIERYAAQGVKVRLATLLTNDSDADSDLLSITVSSASLNAGTVTVSGGWVFYTPAAGFTNTDSFTYTVGDGQGGSTLSTVTITLKVDDAASQNLATTDQGSGSFLIRGDGIPGRVYRLQYTDTLTPANWQDLAGGSVTADSAGSFAFTDTTGSGSRSYRSVNP